MSATERSVPMRRAAPPAEALYSSASPGAPWLVSEPIARPYFIIFDRVRPIVVCIAAVPALHANSKSAAVRTGAEPIASRSEEHTSELQSRQYLVCRLLVEKHKRVANTLPPLDFATL